MINTAFCIKLSILKRYTVVHKYTWGQSLPIIILYCIGLYFGGAKLL